MLQIHPYARTTSVTRAEIARSQDPTSLLTQRYGVSTETIRKWRKRGFCCKVLASVASDPCKGQLTSQAATLNSSAMNFAWALMSLPLMLRTCPFLIIAIAS